MWNPKAKPDAQFRRIEGPFPTRWSPEPAVAGEYAYFVSQGRLVRRTFVKPGPLEVLAVDAIRGTRAVATMVGSIAVAAYIAEPLQEGGDRRARLWVEGHGIFDLSPEGSGATSVALQAQGDRKLLAVALEGRTAMSPIHGRFIELDASSLRIGPDVVLNVAPGAEAYSEITLARSGKTSFALVPITKSPREFGLMVLPIGDELRMETTPSWVLYPNGLDPAPVATANACGKTFVAFVRASDPRPGSPAVIELRTIDDNGLAPSGELLATARFVRALSMAAGKDALLVVWVADGHTFAKTLRC